MSGQENQVAVAIKIMDVKCPGSGEASKMHWPNLARADVVVRWPRLQIQAHKYIWTPETRGV
jgi:hypothetical protein